MNIDTLLMTIVICITVLMIIYGGEPDLMDTVISFINASHPK